MRVYVCGGRNYGIVSRRIAHDRVAQALELASRQRASLHGKLHQLHKSIKFSVLICGDQGGAERLAKSWAAEHGVQLEVIPADWDAAGLQAGFDRNKHVVDVIKPDLIAAFEGGEVTHDLIDKARAAGIEVIHFSEKQS